MSWYLKKRIPTIEFSFDHPSEVQQQQFNSLLSSLKKTSFGKEYGLKEVETYENFKKNVPLFEYDDIKPYIQRTMQGEQRVLWPEEITWFAKSSGTTSDKSKFIPVSFETLENCQFRGSRDVLAFYFNDNPGAKIFQGKGLLIGGSHEINELSDNTYYGDLSAVMMNNMPFIANFLSTPSMDIALINNWEEKLERMIEATYNVDVTNISGVPTWTLILIQHLLEKGETTNLLDIWPNLELYVHGGVNFDPYRREFDRVIPPNQMSYRETYNASEGFFGLQDSNDKDMLFMLDYGIFYEFIEVADLQLDNPETKWIDNIEVGKNYAVVLNSNAGLWRYIIGDTIMFTSKNPWRFKVTGRTKLYINAFGEELMIGNAEKAISEAQKLCDCQVSDYTVAPVYLKDGNQGMHQWLIEFYRKPESISEFAEILDKELKKTNSDYEAKRNGDLALLAPKVDICKEGTFYNWLKSKNQIGGQHKTPRLSNDRKIIEELLEFTK